MSNQFLLSTSKMIKMHGSAMTYTQVQEGTYNIETGSTTNTSTNYTVTMYKKHLKTDQYNYPDLIGRSAAMFYLANAELEFTPTVRDKILVDGETFEIQSLMEHRARGQLVLYKLVATRG
jgi:hypothetical protein